MTRKRMAIGAATLLTLAVAGVFLWQGGKLPFGAPKAVAGADTTQGGKDDPENVAVPVELASAERRAIAAYYRSASTVEADRLVELVTRVGGRVHALSAEEGDWVAQGAVLAELENEREKVQLRQAELKLEDQRRQLERNRAMMDQKLISDQEFDVVRGAHELAETERDLARIALEETRLRAPFAGQITQRRIVAGQQVAAGEALVTLADFSPLRVRVHLPEAVARKVSAGQRVLVTPDTGEADLEAVVERIAPVVDPATSTVRLTLLLRDAGAAVRAGGFVKVRITTDTHTDALAVPKTALVEEGGLRSLFVAEADTVRKVEINAGLYDEQYVEVLDGVEEGAFVVTAGQGGLRHGSRISVLNAAAAGYGAAVVASAAGR